MTGRPPFSARHVATIARFKRGDPFKRSKVDDLRRALIATTLVANADIQMVPTDGGRTVDLAVRLEPAPSHTIAGELGYGTGQGARLEASWTDRNFFNPEGALTVRGVAGTSEQLLGVQFRRSNFMRRDQTLNLQASASHQKFDAYEAKTIASPAISSGKATSSGRRSGPGHTAPSCSRPTNAACSAATASRTRARS